MDLRLTFPSRVLITLFIAVMSLVFPPMFVGSAGAGGTCDYSHGLGSYQAGNWPQACWRPYAGGSSFNRQLPQGAPSHPQSDRIVETLLEASPIDHVVRGDSERDGGIAVFWAQPSDPLYEINCLKDWGECEMQGEKIRIPRRATPAGGFSGSPQTHDAHLTVVDQESG